MSENRLPLQHLYSTQQILVLNPWPTARYYSSEARADNAGSQVAQKDVGKSSDVENAKTNTDIAEEQSVEKPPSDIDLKEKEIIDLKVRIRKAQKAL